MLGNVRSLVALVALYSACFSSIALAEQRLALVIGNAAYKDLPQLFKARNDARAVGATLRQLKFDEVQEGYDLSRDEMSRAFSNLIFRVERGGTVFFFFAGHGVEIGGQNYLLPTDVPAAKEGQENPPGRRYQRRVRRADLHEPSGRQHARCCGNPILRSRL